MAYRTRILSPSESCPPLPLLVDAVNSLTPPGELNLETGTQDQWEQLTLAHTNGTPIALADRDRVEEGSLGLDELKEFRELVSDCRPDSAVEWLNEYFEGVRVIYAFQLLAGTEIGNGWELLDSLRDTIWQHVGGILQADREGFSNESGYHILWQFADTVTGLFNMGVLRNGEWVHFRMDLANRRHRKSFLRGKVPRGVRVV